MGWPKRRQQWEGDRMEVAMGVARRVDSEGGWPRKCCKGDGSGCVGVARRVGIVVGAKRMLHMEGGGGKMIVVVGDGQAKGGCE